MIIKDISNLVLLIFTILVSCDLPNDITEPKQYGVKFEIDNSTNEEFNNAKVIIGGINGNNEFVEVDSYALPKITKGIQQILDGFDDKRWKPNFDEIKKVGDGKAYFKFQFEDKQANFIEYVNNPDLNIYIDLTKFEVFDDNGSLEIRINNNSIFDKNGDKIYAYNSAMAKSQLKKDNTEK